MAECGTEGGSVVLFYRYCALAHDVVADLVAEQRALCQALGLQGRLLLAPGQEGVNGTLGGPAAAVQAYVNITTTACSDIGLQAQCTARLHEAWSVAAKRWWLMAARAPTMLLHLSDFKWSRYQGPSAPFADLYGKTGVALVC